MAEVMGAARTSWLVRKLEVRIPGIVELVKHPSLFSFSFEVEKTKHMFCHVVVMLLFSFFNKKLRHFYMDKF